MTLELDGRALAGRRVTVLGLGLQGGGVEVVRALVSAGASVTVSDRRDAAALAPSIDALGALGALGTGARVRFALGGHDPRDLEATELLVVNPAVSPRAPELVRARAAGVRLTSEIELFLANVRARVAVVTGTQGKSTTCHLAAGLLERAGLPVHLGGNIGRSLLAAIDAIGPADAVVLELSSYQLEALPRPAAPLARSVVAGCVTNVLSDHLERHGSQEAYEAAKRRLLELVPAGRPLLLPLEDARIARWNLAGREVVRVCARTAGSATGAGLHLAGGRFRLGSTPLARVADLALPGEFQRANALAALGLAHALGAEPAALEAGLAHCRGLPHRLEDLGLRAGHRVWDNGVSTTPDSTVSALAALEERGEPVTLLAGGQAKGLPLDGLARAAAAGARRVVTFGHSGPELARAFRARGVEVIECARLEEAVQRAFARMEAGEALLFSPACASFDRYLNFQDRARAFRAALPA